ncbi:hypothetical protein CBS101457_002814 [Exobasidium rhododendri]|nr:hypothetical protein CBS101457_002814 [Exobasidium rhododendri]
MSLARSVISFCIDISPTMGAKRKITEEVTLPSQEGEATTRERTTTDLQWINEFVAKKIQNYILSGLKTAKVHLLLFGSPRTNNTLLESTDVKEGYEGIDEIFKPDQPTIATLELLRCLRASKAEEKPYPADPLDALVAAITTLNNKAAGGTTNTWRRTIYLITDGKSVMNKSDVKLIQDKLIEDNITLKVVGIDFDDAEVGFKEEDKDAIKADNEAWWRTFLASLPSSGMATAAHVIAQSSLPSIHLQGSAPTATSLTFGDPAERHTGNEVMNVPVKLYKATATARPLGQKKLSKIAQESAAAQSQTARMSQQFSQYKPSSTPHLASRKSAEEQMQNGETGLTYGVQLQKKYFIKDDLEMVEGGIEGAEPLAEGAEEKFDKAYKLGATLVAINEDLERQLDTTAGMEIIQFTNSRSYRRQYHMGETWFLFASDGNYKAQLQLSSLINAMSLQAKYAIVRFVRRDGAEPKLGILAPVVKGEIDSVPCECLCYVEAPFREDLKRFTFPPLDRVINRDGKELEEHASLPSTEMQSCMDEMVDSMDLMDAAEEEEGEGSEAEPWFKCVESFNPAIHATKEAVSWRVFHPEDKSLPRPHPEVIKYLQIPKKVEKRSLEVGKRCRDIFELGAYFPVDKKAAKRQAEERARLAGDVMEDEEKKEINLEGVMDEEVAAEEAARKTHPKKQIADDSDTETEEDEEEDVIRAASVISPSKAKDSGQARAKTTFSDVSADKSASPTTTKFEEKLADPKFQVEDVLDEMGDDIISHVTTSFGSNGYSQASQLIKAMRKAAIEYEEVDLFNSFLRKFKDLVLDESASRPRVDFWDRFMRGIEALSLITDKESLAEDSVNVSDKDSLDFINL